MNDTLFNMLLALIPLVGIIFTYIIGKVASKHGKNLDFKATLYWTEIAVAIIEDRYGEDTGKLKKQDVLDFLKKHGISLDAEQMDLLIESVFKELTLNGVINKNKSKKI